MMKALVLLSGGLDSTTCLAMAVDKYGSANVIALTSFYGQRHKKEIEAAWAVAKRYGVKHIVINLTEPFIGAQCSLLDAYGGTIKKTTYAEQLKETGGAPVDTYVPFRNGLFLSVAAAVAISNGCEEVYYGAHKDDAAGGAYPDCTNKFNEAMSKAVYVGSGEAVKIVAPFINKNKSEVVKEGLRLHAPYELTWSCYEGGERPCGACATCRDRAKAFAENGAVDPAM